MTDLERTMHEDREPHETDPYGDLFEGFGDWLAEQAERWIHALALRLEDLETIDKTAAVEMRRAA